MKRDKIRALPRLKEVLQVCNIQQKDMANDLGYSIDCIYKTVNRKTGSKRSASEISNYLGMSQSELFEVVK